MGFDVLAIQGLGQVSWPQTARLDGNKPKSAAEAFRDHDPAGAKTPEEALTYIQQLYQNGRTDELAGLLRQSEVFRDAWQNLQQSSSASFEEAAASSPPVPDAALTPSLAGLPAPVSSPGFSSESPHQDQDTAVPQVVGGRGLSPEIPASTTYPSPIPKPSHTLSVALHAYGTQARNFSQGGAGFHLVSVRV